MFECYLYHYRIFPSTSNVKTYRRKCVFKTAKGLCRYLKRLSWRSDAFAHDAIVYVPVPHREHRILIRIRFEHNLFESTFLNLFQVLCECDYITYSDSVLSYNERLQMEFKK